MGTRSAGAPAAVAPGLFSLSSPPALLQQTSVIFSQQPPQLIRKGTNAVLSTNMGRRLVARDPQGVRLLYLSSKIMNVQNISNVDQSFSVSAGGGA